MRLCVSWISCRCRGQKALFRRDVTCGLTPPIAGQAEDRGDDERKMADTSQAPFSCREFANIERNKIRHDESLFFVVAGASFIESGSNIYAMRRAAFGNFGTKRFNLASLFVNQLPAGAHHRSRGAPSCRLCHRFFSMRCNSQVTLEALRRLIHSITC